MIHRFENNFNTNDRMLMYQKALAKKKKEKENEQ